MDDWQLLQNYVERDSESAFSTLVNRYVNLVYSVAFRQTQNSQLAEEVAQAVFLLLARKARGLRHGVVLSGWLFRTTRFVARRAVRAEQRRQRREQEAFAMQQLNSLDDAWKRISPVLDDALEHLGETDRNAILLRFLSDKSHRETAAALGVSEDAAKKRVTRALDKLRELLTGRGVALSAAVLASTIAANAAKAAPPEVITSITAKVVASSSIGAGVLPPLVSQTLNAWRWAKLKLASGLAIMVAVGVGIALLQRETSVSSLANGSSELSSAAIDGASLDSDLLSNQLARTTQSGERILQFRVLDRATGQGVSNAQLAVLFGSAGKWETRFDLATDSSGLADVRYPRDTGRLDVGVLSWGWAARFAEWKTDNDPVIPEEYTLFVDRMTNTMGGWLRDGRGQPVVNAEIEMLFSYSDMAQSETPRERSGFLHPAVVTRTDQNGWWSCAVLDPKADPFPGLIARHPEFAQADIAARHRANDTNGVLLERMNLLWSGRLVTTMARGLTLTGKVLDKDGQPIVGAQVVHDPASMFLGSRRAETESDLQGSFKFQGLKPGEFDFIVTASGFAQEYQKVNVHDATSSVEVTLKPGGLLRLRVVDERGDAVSGARVAATGFGGAYSADIHWDAESGPDGRIEWNSAPPDRALNLYASKHPDWLMTRGAMAKADGEEHVITLRRALLVTGNVTDADTGEPIHGARAFPGYGMGEYCWYRGETWRSTNETYQVRFAEEKFPWRVRVEAEGYEAFVSEPLPRGFSGGLNVTLRRPDLSKAVRGVVLRPDGTSANGAEVALLTPGHGAYLGRAQFTHREVEDKLITDADDEGRFQFEKDPDADRAHTVVALGEWGFARVPLHQSTEPLTIRLEPWGRVEGTVDSSARSRPIDSLYMQVQDLPGQRGTLQLGSDFRVWQFKGDDFVFDFVPPGDFHVTLNAGSGVPYPEHHRTWLTVKAGETVKILVAERGHRLKGRLVAQQGEGDWAKQSKETTYEELMPGVRVHSRQYRASKFAMLVSESPELTPEENARYNPPTWVAGLVPLQQNHAPGVRMNALLELTTDGSFESLEGVLPGDYKLQVSIDGRNFEQQTITVPEGAPAIVDLGNIMVSPNTPVSGRAVRTPATKTKAQQ